MANKIRKRQQLLLKVYT